MAEMFATYNTIWESHEVITEDLYRLINFRITGFTDTGPVKITKPPVLLINGMLTNGEYWISPDGHPYGTPLAI